MQTDSSNLARTALLLLAGLILPLLWPGVLSNLFSTQDFEIAHHETWSPNLVTLHVGSDLLISLAYTVIAFILAFIVYQNREHLPFNWVILAFGLFIVACGFTHIMHVVVRFYPVYWFDAYVRGLTAVVSVATAVALPALVPKVKEIIQATVALEHKEQELQIALNTNMALLSIVQLAEQRENAIHLAEQVLLKFSDVLTVDWLGLGVQDGDLTHITGIWHSPQIMGSLTQTNFPSVKRGIGMLWLAIEAQRPVYMDDYSSHPSAHPLYLKEDVSSVALLPLIDPTSGNTIVLIASKVGANKGWATWEKQLFETALMAVNVAMERQNYLEQMEIAAFKDVLTGLGNRRAFEKDLKAEYAQARRQQYSFGLMLLDLDCLKTINDQMGHEAGDRLLSLFGRKLKTQMRLEDRCYRLGGDEFAVIFPYSQLDTSPTLHPHIQQLIQEVQAQGFAKVGVSAGIALFPEERSGIEDLIRLADERMYAMKAVHHLERAARAKAEKIVES